MVDVYEEEVLPEVDLEVDWRLVVQGVPEQSQVELARSMSLVVIGECLVVGLSHVKRIRRWSLQVKSME